MKVFVFDLLAYDANLDQLKGGETELPYPLAKRHFDAATAERTYEEHLDAWEAMDRFGYDGVGFNEHHCSPYGLMNSPNLMASAAAQRTKNLKLLIYGNLLPLHEPLRLAEELAMLDCLSNGRLISGFARGIPREYQVHNVPLAINAYVADSKAQAVMEMAPYHLYFNRTLFSHGNFTETALQRQAGYSSQNSTDYVRPENQRAAALLREDFRNMTMADVERQAENLPWGTPAEVTERIIAAAEGAG